MQRFYGCEKEVQDKRDYKMKVCMTQRLPDSYKLEMPGVKDQGSVGSCVAHALSTVLEYIYLEEGKKFSVGFIYGYRPEDYSQNRGMYPRQAMKTICNIGDVLQRDFNYNKEMTEIKDLVNNNLDKLKLLAQEYKIDGYSLISTETEIKQCIYSGMPVPVSIPVRSNLKLNKDFTLKDVDGEIDGYHMIVLYGWDEKGFLFQNSWGEDWGNKGTGIIPYGYDINTAWAISTIDNDVEVYQTFWQKLYAILLKILKYLNENKKK